jgi:exodeoxyribonuclease-3
MRIISWNVNGIRSVYRKGFLDSLQKISADILCLQEIRAGAEDIPPEIAGYFSYWNPSKRKGHSGVAVLSKQKPLKVSHSLGIKEFEGEGRILALDFPKFTLFNLYFPHGRRDKEKLPFKLEAYDSFLEHLKRIDKDVVLCGDFNIAHTESDLARPQGNKNNTMFTPEERERINRILSEGFVDTFRHLNPKSRKYTWWPYYRDARSRDIGWRIDYVFVSKNLIKNVKDAFILSDVQGSDHCPTGIELSDGF